MQPHDTTELNPNVNDITGQRFGRLLVVSFSHTENQRAVWNCLCDCGKECRVPAKRLKNGNTQSCGCLHSEQSRKFFFKHGLSSHPLNGSYRQMLSRCYNSNVRCYPNYGGRGITVCDRWRDSFANFLSDMGERPEGYTLDRIDNNGPYSPDNCRWVPVLQQNNNRRSNRFLSYNGETLTLQQWSRQTGISYATIATRIKAGWSIERALTQPVQAKHRRKA